MDIHLITTDCSAFRLIDRIAGKCRLTRVIVPENRIMTSKIQEVLRESERRALPVSIQSIRSPLCDDHPLADIAVSWLYSQILYPEDLARYAVGTLNMHGGKIPHYRGANVLQWAIINGENELGITWHEMVEQVDAGTIWAEDAIPIGEDATGADVRQQMIARGIDLFPLALERMTSRSGGRKPDLAGGRVWPSRRPADGQISPDLPEKSLRNLVRALCPPWPAAFLEIGGKRVEVYEVHSASGPNRIPYLTSEGRTVYLSIAEGNSR